MLLVPAKKQVPTACSNPVLIHIFQSVLPYPSSSDRLYPGKSRICSSISMEGVLGVTRILFFGGIVVVQLGGLGCADMER